MLKIAVTGGVASGKTVTLNILRQLGYTCVSSDDISANLMTKNQQVIHKIEAILPSVIQNGVVNKRLLRNIMFSKDDIREAVEKVMHPLIFSIREKFLQQQEQNGEKIVFCEVPLLFEKNLEKHFDFSILIASSMDIRLARFISKGGEEEVFLQITKNQLPDSIKKKRANYVISNVYSQEELQEKVQKIVDDIKINIKSKHYV